jgi:hypothetical protein
VSSSLTTSVKPPIQTKDGLKIRFAESAQRGDHALLLRPWGGGSAAWSADDSDLV